MLAKAIRRRRHARYQIFRISIDTLLLMFLSVAIQAALICKSFLASAVVAGLLARGFYEALRASWWAVFLQGSWVSESAPTSS